MTPRADTREVVVATGNPGKLAEICAILDDERIPLRSLEDLPAVVMPEEGDDYAANAISKAVAVARSTGRPAIADDSGLEVEALGGRPGARSARYGGPGLRDEERVSRLLGELAATGDASRAARFVCVAALATPEGAIETARGECGGTILPAARGRGGFGYDPIFVPLGEQLSMAELPADHKNRISHRGRAFRALRSAIVRAIGENRCTAPASFLLVRHGESEWNAAGRWQGHGDPPLTERGVAQAVELARELGHTAADLLVSSDLQRAWETAGVLGRVLGLAPRPDPRLRELDVGRWSGLTRDEIAARDAALLAQFDSGDPHARAGGAESRAELRERVQRAMREWSVACGGGRILAVTHLGVIRALAGRDIAPGERLACSLSSLDGA